MPEPAYLRFPSIRGELLSFVADDDVWLAELGTPAEGQPRAALARRLTADHAPASDSRLSPDGSLVAYTGRRDGAPEAYVVGTSGEAVRRLSFFGDPFTRVIGWEGNGFVIVISAGGQPFRSRTWAYRVPVSGGAAERLAYGPITGLARGEGGATVLGVNQSLRRGPAWKRYRGGTAASLWIDADGSGSFERYLAELDGQLEDPALVGGRVLFVSDHEGYGNLYSALPDGSDLRRHSDHGDFYARAAASDGRRVVYQCAGELHLLSDLASDSTPVRLAVDLGSPRTGRARQMLRAEEELGELAPDHDGRASAVELRGQVHLLAHRDGPARWLGGGDGVRARLPHVAGRGEAAVALFVSDAEGEDALEVVPLAAPGSGAASEEAGGGEAGGAGAGTALGAGAGAGAGPGTDPRAAGGTSGGGRRRLAAGLLGRVLELACSPDARHAAVATHDGRVLLVDLAEGSVRQLDHSEHGDASGLSFSPDSGWLAWSHAGPEPLSQIKVANVGSGESADVTSLRFRDHDPVFGLDGKHLVFLSERTFDPVYDTQVFDLSFLAGSRPYLVTLRAGDPSPFAPEPGGRPRRSHDDKDEESETPAVTIDLEGIDERVVAFPVEAGRYAHLRAARHGVLFLDLPVLGVLGEERARPGDEAPRAVLARYDFAKLRRIDLAHGVDDFEVAGDGRSLVLRDGRSLRVVPADREVEAGGSNEPDPDDYLEVDLGRLRVELDPPTEWRQMYDEAARLMRDHYWIADMSGVDWEGVVARYRPLLERIATRDDLSELIWEVQGELGSSHAYERPPDRPAAAERRLGFLGADFEQGADGRWRVTRVLPGETSVLSARSPLAGPGAGVRPGDAVVAIDGRPLAHPAGPPAMLAGAGGKPVELLVESGGSGERRSVVVEPLKDERPLRYQDWVAGRRAATHELSGGRVGYVHIPDMMGSGWAELHRDLRLEVAYDALVVDVRDNGGGHTSQLVLEKLGRVVRGWDTVRHKSPEPYPSDSPRGVRVLLTNEQAGSDGDIVTAGFRQRRLGPVLGTRTWGGVIGIDARYTLVDGTSVTQPRYAFWFGDGFGWDVENHGVDPDIEVSFAPQDWAAGRDPQLERAVQLCLELLEQHPPARPPDPATRPSRVPPPLPPRP